MSPGAAGPSKFKFTTQRERSPRGRCPDKTQDAECECAYVAALDSRASKLRLSKVHINTHRSPSGNDPARHSVAHLRLRALPVHVVLIQARPRVLRDGRDLPAPQQMVPIQHLTRLQRLWRRDRNRCRCGHRRNSDGVRVQGAAEVRRR